MDNRTKKVIEFSLIAFVVLSVILFETIYPFVLGISIFIIIFLERKNMNKKTFILSLILWIIATFIICIKHFIY